MKIPPRLRRNNREIENTTEIEEEKIGNSSEKITGRFKISLRLRRMIRKRIEKITGRLKISERLRRGNRIMECSDTLPRRGKGCKYLA